MKTNKIILLGFICLSFVSISRAATHFPIDTSQNRPGLAISWMPGLYFSGEEFTFLLPTLGVEYQLKNTNRSLDITTTYQWNNESFTSNNYSYVLREKSFQFDLGYRIYKNKKSKNSGFYLRPSLGLVTLFSDFRVKDYIANIGENIQRTKANMYVSFQIGSKVINKNMAYNINGGIQLTTKKEYDKLYLLIGPHINIGIGYQR